MARLMVMYRTPADLAAFDDYYFESHVPIAKRIPGLLKYEVSKGPIIIPGGASDYHLIAMLYFGDVATLQEAIRSPEGQAAGADVEKFATGGAEMYVFDDREV